MRRGLNKLFALLFTDGGEVGGDKGDGAGGGAEDLYPLDIAEEAPLLPVTMLVLWLAMVFVIMFSTCSMTEIIMSCFRRYVIMTSPVSYTVRPPPRDHYQSKERQILLSGVLGRELPYI